MYQHVYRPCLNRQDSVLRVVDGKVVAHLPKRGEPSEPRRQGEQPKPARGHAVRVGQGVINNVDWRDHDHHEEGGVQRDIPREHFRIASEGAKEGVGHGYHSPKTDQHTRQTSKRERSEGDLRLVCLVCWPVLVSEQTRGSRGNNSHFCIVLGLPCTITINIP